MEELKRILDVGHISVGKEAFVFQRWSTSVSRIDAAFVEGHRWIKGWGLPLLEWSLAMFTEIDCHCGRLVEIDHRFANQEIVSVVRMKVGARSLLDIPRMLRWSLDKEVFVLVIEVEVTMLFVVSLRDLNSSKEVLGEETTTRPCSDYSL